MYLRISKTKQKTGVAEYVQLVQSVRHPETGVPRAQVIHHFGRRDQLDLAVLRRLIKNIARFLDDDETAATTGEGSPFEFVGARAMGATWLLDALWKRLEIDQELQKLLTKRDFSTPIERLLFAMVANRALAPSSKLAMEDWIAKDVVIPGLEAVSSDQLYRAMDFLLEADAEIQKAVFFNVANLLNLEVDVIFLDTTSTYFEVENPDDPEDPKLHLRRRGKSKDNHPELPQVVVGFAITREGIPVRCWTWAGNTNDQTVIDEVKRDLNGWKLGRVITVADTGFNSAENRRKLQTAGGHYILGEKLRTGPKGLPVDVLSRAGRFKNLDDDLEIKEVIVDPEGAGKRRFVVVRNPDEARRDKAKREDILAEVRRRLDALKELNGEPHAKAECALRSHETFGRYVAQTPKGRLTLNREKIAQEELLDGKYLISSSDDSLSAEDVVRGYKALWRIERAFRDLKHGLDIRPVYHRLSDRIRAHVLLCWLALLLVRVAENESKQTWRTLRAEMGRLKVGIHQTPHGEIWQTGRLTPAQQAAYQSLQLDPPPKNYLIPTPRVASSDL
jgi:transposase